MPRKSPAAPPSESPSATTTALANVSKPPIDRKYHQTAPRSQSPLEASISPVSKASPGRVAEEDMDLSNLSRKSQWIILAVASGACAAFNGVFAKLTTTELTTSFAAMVSRLLGLGQESAVIEMVIRAMFFGLNLLFNGVMWALFTKALARGTSTTQVAIINTSSNFMITAILGFFIFSEALPPLWWVGAALLVAGNVIIGRREEKEKDVDEDGGARSAAGDGEGRYSEEEVLLGENVELSDELEVTVKKTPADEDDILDLGTPMDEMET